MATRPRDLIYSVDETPPWTHRLVLAVQHVCVLSVGWIFIVLAVTMGGGTATEASDVIRMSMIASGVGTVLQARTRGPVGSGYLCPFSAGPSYISATVAAGAAGGLPLVFGLTAITGLFQGLLSRLLRRVRVLFPPEVTGLVVAMVGIQLVGLGAPRFIGLDPATHVHHPRSMLVSLITILAMIVPTVWGRGRWRLYPVLFGMAAGYAAAAALGLFAESHLRQTLAVPWVGLPRRAAAGFDFQLSLLLPFLIATLASSLKAVGDLTLCQKMNDAEWKRTDLRSAGGGLLSGAIATSLAGLLGGVGQSTFSANVGLSAATSTTSCAIALPIGVVVIALTFFPKLAAVFTLMPEPVVGAVLVYVACYMIVGGLQVLTSRMLDARKTFVVGISFFFGLSAEMVPGLYSDVPLVLQPMVATSLTLTTMLAIALNLLFRLGVSQRATLELSAGDDADRIFGFMESNGAAWGARPEVIRQAATAINECYEIAIGARLTDGPIAVAARFDELSLDVELSYVGKPMLFSAMPPSRTEVVRDPSGAVRLAGVIVQRLATRVETREKDGRWRVLLHFEH